MNTKENYAAFRASEGNDEYIWTVTYLDDNKSEPVVTSFNNEDAAKSCYKYFSKFHKCCIDKCNVYSSFDIKE